jgi:hypothetical protein
MTASCRLIAGPAPVAFVLLLIVTAPPAAQAPSAPLDPTIQKLGEYVAGYGEKASIFVAVETYTQIVTTPETAPVRPRQLVAEFAIVKAAGGWIGFRDVVEVNGEKLVGRRDRLLRLLTDFPGDGTELTRLANESARFNMGPVVTNVNVPTTALFFFQPSNLHRFMFTRNGVRKVEGVDTIEFDFKETSSPTLVMTNSGKDVPVEGTLYVVPDDGAVVRTRLKMKGFADSIATTLQQAPSERPAVNPNTRTGGREALAAAAGTGSGLNPRDIKTAADIEVTYSRHQQIGLWLPSRMVEQYEGAIKLGTRPPFPGLSTTRARYSDFKQFGTGAIVKIPK